ncbi:hypothetical protein HU200_058259 [Digitaria exilis]|uniref:UDP-glycosyltransferase n=1 Tax=Digitaria exilis TaxID=1010633 RepID=A0A835AE77_9POAL|nr:hypothetical protein HU200_058259 [Digitaria exilis]
MLLLPSSMDTQEPVLAPAETLEDGDHGNGKPHVLVVPFPAQGHMLALLDLAALLATSGKLSVTVAVTTGNAALLDPLRASCPSVGVVTLPFPSSPFLPAGCGENTNELPLDHFRMYIPSLALLHAPLLSWCRAQPQRRRVTAVISDVFTGWARPLAEELGARHVTFSPCSALYIAIWRHLCCSGRSMPRNTDDGAGDDDELAIAWRQLSTEYQILKDGDEVYKAMLQIWLLSLGAEHVVVNSFAALEPSYLEHRVPSSPTAQPRVLAVGPLSEAWANSGDRGGKPSVPAATVAAWLDAFETGSVVYVSFGTQHALSPEQVACVADALALSSAPFVWAMWTLTVLPEGFEAATASRGTVIRGWAPQVEILRHRAVGWFLMHCGMNALLEAVSAGVAMLTWPMGADHFVNRMLLREAGVAIDVAEGADAVPDAAQMAKAIATAVGDEGKPIRERAVELGREAVAAVAEGGSSHRDLQELIRLLANVD